MQTDHVSAFIVDSVKFTSSISITMQNLVVVSQLCALCMHVGGPKKFEALGPCPFGWECG